MPPFSITCVLTGLVFIMGLARIISLEYSCVTKILSSTLPFGVIRGVSSSIKAATLYSIYGAAPLLDSCKYGICTPSSTRAVIPSAVIKRGLAILRP